MTDFSIITCTLNSEPFIDQCIASVKLQTHSQVEHVFVDGGSTDGTLEKIQSLSGNIRWVTGIRGGISNAMNVGAEMASGKFIAHLHGDDYFLHPQVLSSVSSELEMSSAKWLFARIVSDVGGELIKPTWSMPKYSRDRLLRGNFIAHPAVFIEKRAFIDAGGFDFKLKYAMDYDLWLRVSKLHTPCYLDDYVSAFRRHLGSTSTANAIAAFKEDYEVRKRNLVTVRERVYHDLIYRWRLARKLVLKVR